MLHNWLFILILSMQHLALLAAPPAPPQATPAPMIATRPNYTINLDSPAFRKLVVALPSFKVIGSDTELKAISTQGLEDLTFLFEFTGLFNVMKRTAYDDILKQPTPAQSGGTSLPGFENINLLQWKAIGVESLSTVKIERINKALQAEFRTADINKAQSILSKTYIIKNKDDFYDVSKRYLDELMQAYTGRKGIFSTKIAFIGKRTATAPKQVFTCDIDGRNLKQLTSSNSTHLSPSWSPDGKQLLFTSYDAKNPDLYLFDISTGKTKRIAGFKGVNSGGTFSPKGNGVIVLSGSTKKNSDLFVIKPPYKDRKELVHAKDINVDPHFSPDGNILFFSSGRFGNPHIFRGEIQWDATMTQMKLTKETRLTYAGWWNVQPAMSPDMQKILFAGFDKEIKRFDLFMVNPDGTNLERLTLHSGDNGAPTWAPNGHLIMFQSSRKGTSDVKGPTQLFLMNRDGSEQRLVYTGLYEAEAPKWGPYLD